MAQCHPWHPQVNGYPVSTSRQASSAWVVPGRSFLNIAGAAYPDAAGADGRKWHRRASEPVARSGLVSAWAPACCSALG